MPTESMSPYEGCRYSGINDNELVRLGMINSNVTLDNIERKIQLIVVPNNTMRSSVVLGRDALKVFNLGLMTLPEVEARATKEIFYIDVRIDNLTDLLEINSEVGHENQTKLKQLFLSEYWFPELPEFPKTRTD